MIRWVFLLATGLTWLLASAWWYGWIRRETIGATGEWSVYQRDHVAHLALKFGPLGVLLDVLPSWLRRLRRR
jgi:hypothetical protein